MNARFSALSLAVAVAAVAFTSATALAQGPGGFGRGMGRGGMFGNDPTFLLSAEPVQKELELSDDQKTQVTKLTDDNRQAMMDLRGSGLSFEEMGTKMQERAKENTKKIKDILLADQVVRLEQIGIQIAGAGALSRPDIVEKLKITDDQKQKLTDLGTEVGQKMQDIFAGGPPADDQERQDRQTKMAKITAEQKEKALALLTADQRDQFEKMQGKKFEYDPQQLFRGFGRGRGRGPGGAGGAGN